MITIQNNNWQQYITIDYNDKNDKNTSKQYRTTQNNTKQYIKAVNKSIVHCSYCLYCCLLLSIVSLL